MQPVLTYDQESDILNLRWPQPPSAARIGTEINENIVIFTDAGQTTVFGLMLISYQELIKVTSLELTGLRRTPADTQTCLRRLLRQEPLRRFLLLDHDDHVTLRNGQILLTSHGPKLTTENLVSAPLLEVANTTDS